MKRIMIAGTNSGCGKTTVTCALLEALKVRGLVPVAFKCGPDYIDPTFHRAVTEIEAYNLDPFFLGGGLIRHLASHSNGGISVIEGAMGYYDGIAATSEASAYTVASATKTPVVLVVSARGAGSSLGAVIEGFVGHRENNYIKGVIFNDANERRYPDLERIASSAGVRAYGYMVHRPEWEFPARHLGLMSAGEIAGLQKTFSELGRQALQSLDIDGLIELSGEAADIPAEKIDSAHTPNRGVVRLAVAYDDAFCFYYKENFELLEKLGVELVFFSPMRDKSMPENINGLYIGGGYPELHTNELSENTALKKDVLDAVNGGLPTIAEGGGFLYLHETLDGVPMCGVIRGTAYKTERLRRFGYITLTANRDNLLCKAGDGIRSHEFHYWESFAPGCGFTACKAGRTYSCVHVSDSLYAGFPHLYFPANPAFGVQFYERMAKYG